MPSCSATCLVIKLVLLVCVHHCFFSHLSCYLDRLRFFNSTLLVNFIAKYCIMNTIHKSRQWVSSFPVLSVAGFIGHDTFSSCKCLEDRCSKFYNEPFIDAKSEALDGSEEKKQKIQNEAFLAQRRIIATN